MPKGVKYGGRQKGSLNKTTAISKQVITELLSDYHNSGLMTEDFKALEPKERIAISEKLMQYVMPKMQSTAVDLNATVTEKTIEDKLAQLAGENDL